MALLLHGSGSEGDVLWVDQSEKGPGRIEANHGKGAISELQLHRSNWNCSKAFLGGPLCYRLRTFTAHPAELPARRCRPTAGSPNAWDAGGVVPRGCQLRDANR